MGFLFKSVFLTLFLLSHQIKAETFSNFSSSSSKAVARKLASRCNIFRGKWVYDAKYPLYDQSTCPFIDPQFNCQKYGRPDSVYQKYRWQPFSCSLPRFNGLYFLMKYRGKKIMFVGDSVSMNMWESLTCMIYQWVPKARTTIIRTSSYGSVTFEEYGVQLIIYKTPFIVDLVNENGARVLKVDSIKAGVAWRGMDMLIFNTWHWWTHSGGSIPWDYVQEGNKKYQNMNYLVAYYKGLNTWARWVNQNVDTRKTKVFFQGISPTHAAGIEWNEPKQTCYGQTQPYFGSKYPAGIPPANFVVNRVLSRMKKPVYLLDITGLSQYRKDAHPEAYSGMHQGIVDCSHWCLPGLPDTWNQLLYAALFS